MRWRFLIALCLAGASGPAMAAGDGHGGGGGGLLSIDVGTAFWTLVLFIVLLVVLGKFVWPQIVGGLQAREQKIRGDIEAAERANAEAQQTLEDYKKRLAEAHTEARSVLDQAKSDAEALRQRLSGETEQELTRMRQRAADEIDAAKTAAVKELYAKAGELAVAAAGKILEKQIDATDTEKLIEQSLAELDKLEASG